MKALFTACFFDLKVWRRHPALAVMTLLFGAYKLLTVSDLFARRVGRAYGLTSTAALEIATPFHIIARLYGYLDEGARDRPFVDLGCGYGSLLWYVAMRGVPVVVGIEKNPAVAEVARRWVGLTLFGRQLFPSCARVQIIQSDACEMPPHNGVYWLGWTGFSDEERDAMTVALRQLPVGATVATTTHPINGDFVVLSHRFRDAFFWGLGTVYIYEVVLSKNVLGKDFELKKPEFTERK